MHLAQDEITYVHPHAYLANKLQSASISTLFDLERSGHCPLLHEHTGDRLVDIQDLCIGLELGLLEHNVVFLQVMHIIMIV